MNKQDKIYLEISGRRMGKTRALVKAFKEYPSSNKYIVTPFMGAYRQYDVPREYILTPRELFDRRKWGGSAYTPHNSRLFWDECDIEEKHLSIFIKEGDYYVTTPTYSRSRDMVEAWRSGFREDLLLSLIRFNNGSYVTMK